MNSSSFSPDSSGCLASSSAADSDWRTAQRYRLLAENAPTLLIETSLEGQVLYVSPNFERILGHAADTFIARSFFSNTHPEDIGRFHARLSKPEGKFTVRWRHGDQSWRWLEINMRDLRRPDGSSGRWLLATDVSEWKKAEAENTVLETRLSQAQRLESLGILAAGVAHDFNNIVGAIMANTDLAQLEAPAQGGMREYLREIMTASVRARSLIRQVLNFSHQQKTERCPISLKPVVDEVLRLIRSTAHENIRIQVELSADVGLVRADPTQIHQVLMNLCTNSVHAIGTREGRLDIRVDQYVFEEGPGRKRPVPNCDEYVRIIVSDTGTGMDETTLKRVFDPFFTTRRTGEGTGLGLCIVQEIVKNHGGSVQIASRPDEGTAIQVLLPGYTAPGETRQCHQ